MSYSFPLVFFILFFLSNPLTFAFNEEAKTQLHRLFEKNSVASNEELIEILLPIAKDKNLSHMRKISDMSYVVFISGHRLSKEKKNNLFFTVFEVLDLRRKATYLQENPDINEKTKKAIRNSRVFIGMSKEQVEASLGTPEEVRPPIGSFLDKERWSYYSKRMAVYFKDGLLIHLKKM